MPERDDKTLQGGVFRPPLPPAQYAGSHVLPAYAELHCISNFSFQRGASHPEELVQQAYALGYAAIAITDECSVAGVVRAHMGLRQYVDDLKEKEEEARQEGGAVPSLRHPFQLLLGSEFAFDGFRLVAIARDLRGWGNLCEFISAARRTATKGTYEIDWGTSDFDLLDGCEIVHAPVRSLCAGGDVLPTVGAMAEAICADLARTLAKLGAHSPHAGAPPGSHIWLACELGGDLDDDLWLAALRQASEESGVALLAAGDVHMHRRGRKPLHDVITAVREGRPVAECGFALLPSGERHLRTRMKLAQVYPPQLLANTLLLAARCSFSLDEIKYNYPRETVPEGLTPAQALRQFTLEGARDRYPGGIPAKQMAQIEKELAIIAIKQYEMYFLTVQDIVRFARSKNILCQGRGSAANSTVCYCLHVTEVRPEESTLLFERFISVERDEPPDIDVDFEHQRREEVIQYIYGKYGRERAAIAAVVIRYRSRSAIRDVGKALGIDAGLVDAFAKDHHWFDTGIEPERLVETARAIGVEEEAFRLAQWIELTKQLRGFPRHLSQHVGGFVLTESKLTRLVPVENAAMIDRSIIQWEKDDLEAVGLMKVDVLALGMLSAIRRCLDFRAAWRGVPWRMQEIPKEDPATYDMICRADTVGVFQVESRAQMSMLPRLRPREFYDLVVEVAIVRPGPIQGGMVHPYLKRRLKRESVTYPSEALRTALERTLGVPIFQEQVMQIAVLAADFTPGEADRLRRSMAAWKHTGHVSSFRDRLIGGMTKNGYAQEFAESIFKQMEGFGDYGFPESHAASFAKLVYISCWLKRHEPACFLAALLNAQPMGFYTPSQLVQDARRHDVEVRPVDVTLSGAESSIEAPGGEGFDPQGEDGRNAGAQGQDNTLQPCVRLGLHRVNGLGKEAMKRIVEARAQAPFTSVEDLALRAALDTRDMNALAAADALSSLAGHRRQQAWQAAAQRNAPALLKDAPIQEDFLHLPQASEGEDIVFDFAATRLSLRRHPLALLRPRLAAMDLMSASQLAPLPHGDVVRACGIVALRQRPQTAKGTIFVSLEDETGTVNVIVWSHVVEEQRDALLKSRLLAVEGLWQRDVDSGGRVRHLVARKLHDLTHLLGRMGDEAPGSRDFH